MECIHPPPSMGVVHAYTAATIARSIAVLRADEKLIVADDSMNGRKFVTGATL
jgi:hypothetical protein